MLALQSKLRALAGKLTKVGARVSTTVNNWLRLTELVHPSVAVQVRRKELLQVFPEAGPSLEVTDWITLQESVAVGVPVLDGSVDSTLHSRVLLATKILEKTGAMLSVKKMF
jgi:hypothetical protein